MSFPPKTNLPSLQQPTGAQNSEDSGGGMAGPRQGAGPCVLSQRQQTPAALSAMSPGVLGSENRP